MEPPNTTDFTTFLRNVAGISTAYLPDGSNAIQYAFDEASNIADTDLGQVPYASTSWSPLSLATYNLGTHLLIEYATDQQWSISALSWTNGLVTVTSSAPTTVAVDIFNKVLINGVSPNAYNGIFAVNAVSNPTHFVYALSPNPGVAASVINAYVQQQYFANARSKFKISSFVPGVVSTSADVSTSAGLDNPNFMKGLTLENLDLLKTPYGRAYLSIAQKYGPTIWGIS